jgi:hypothetical protein
MMSTPCAWNMWLYEVMCGLELHQLEASLRWCTVQTTLGADMYGIA